MIFVFGFFFSSVFFKSQVFYFLSLCFFLFLSLYPSKSALAATPPEGRGEACAACPNVAAEREGGEAGLAP